MSGGRRAGSFLAKFAAGLGFAVVFDTVMFRWMLGPAGFGGMELLLLGATLAVRPAMRRDRRTLGCLGVAAAMALAMTFDPGLLAWSMYWIFAGLGALLPASARFGDAWGWSQRLVRHGLRAVIAPLLDLRRLLRIRRRHNHLYLKRMLPHLVLPVLGSAVILALFAAANPVIERLAEELLSITPDAEWGARTLLGTVWFAMAWSLLRPRMARNLFGTFDGTGELALTGVTPASVRTSLILFNALFAIQNVMDLVWLWGVAPLPRGMTLADYAHRGAYPLIITALLAAGFVLVALRPGSQTAAMPLVRRLVVVWIAQNVLLVFNAALRTLDYVAAYSLTQLRLAALLWMGLVALGLVLVLWRMLAGKSTAWLINANAAASLAVLCTCTFVDLDAVSARYNIANARELGGRGAALDICHLQRMGVSALVPLAELEQRPAPEAIHLWARLLRENAQARLQRDLAEGRWSMLGEMRLARVRTLLRTGALNPHDYGWQDCTFRDTKALAALLDLARLPAPRPAGALLPAAAPTPAVGGTEARELLAH